MVPRNVLFLFSDEHNRDLLGCYGDPHVRTPHLDRLAQRGTRFSNAYTNSPICVSARASLATGKYPHEISAWDSAAPYEGRPPSWGSQLVADGHEVVSIGKLHYQKTRRENGFSREFMPMHVVKGVGWVQSLLRDPPIVQSGVEKMAGEAGVGESTYTAYDRAVADRACDWLKETAAIHRDKPWMLFVGLVAPHFPLSAPEEFYSLYDPGALPPPRLYDEAERPRHPVIEAMRFSYDYDKYFDERTMKVARAAYYALCSFLDAMIGKILCALEDSGMADDTVVVYSTDHGDNMGNRGLWGKSVMYEDSVAVPMIMAGPGVPLGQAVETPVSLIDLPATFFECLGASGGSAIGPGRSLFRFIETEDPTRPVFSEYHDGGAITGMFMLRCGRWKYIAYPGYPAQLFDLTDDPHEERDLGPDPAFTSVRANCDRKLREICDYETVNRTAFAEQEARIAALGGREAILATYDHGYTLPPTAHVAEKALTEP